MTTLNPNAQPHPVENGIAFTVRVECINRECVISNDALAKLSRLSDGIDDPMQTFLAFEPKISGVARRLVAANVPGTPLRLGPETFR